MFRAAVTRVSRRSDYFVTRIRVGQQQHRTYAASIPIALAALYLADSETERRTKLAHCSVAQDLGHLSQLTPLECSHGRYALAHSLGTGNYGTVYLGSDTQTGADVAIKQIPRAKTTEADILAETSILSSVFHPQVIQLQALYSDRDNWYIVTELASGGELFDKLTTSGITETEACNVMRQVLSGVVHMHGQGVIHCDLKPENLLITSPSDAQHLEVKIADFGSAYNAAHPRKLVDYTAAYSPPEVVSGASGITPAADVWALGVILYILLRGQHPFDTHVNLTEKEISQLVVETEPNWNDSAWENVSKSGKALVQRALNKAPELRPTAAEMLADPFFASLPVDTVETATATVSPMHTGSVLACAQTA